MIAKIAVAAANFAIDKPYSYRIVPGQQIAPGMRVSVPFGAGNRRTEGVVLSVEDGDDRELKPVDTALDDEPLLSRNMLQLAEFMRQRYFCTFYEAVRAMLPAGLWFQTKVTYRLTDDQGWKGSTLRQKDAALLLDQLEAVGGSADDRLLRGDMSEEAFDKAIAYLLRKKWIEGSKDYRRKTGDKTEKIASLAVSAEETMAFVATLHHAPMQRSVLQTLCAVGTVAVKELCYFTGASTATVKRLEAMGYIALSDREVLRCKEVKPAQLDGPLTLNEEQSVAYNGLSAQLTEGEPGVALLYGVTGSGKTSVYLKLIENCLAEGKSAMLLVPEIALTPQLLGLVAAHFGQNVAVLHSSLGAGERYDQWKRVRSGQARVVVGTRSAVFAPCQELGLIILDEEQEHSYRSENSPRYDARQIALWRGNREKALVLLGSATPSVETMYRAKQGAYKLYKLKNRYGGRPLPQVDIIDMGQEVKAGNDLALSYPLLEAMRQTFEDGKQTILFLNRRGNSRSLVCVECGKAPECPRCNARLTYHSANGRVMCHHCGFSRPAPERCDCGGPMKQLGTGTQKVEAQLNQVCPDMSVLRMDTDTVTALNTHEQILDRFKKEKVSVLLGTQMVAKGLNLPDVTLVGVLDADMSLYTDNYRAAETTFDMLTQVVGRSGRGVSAGRAMIQTMAPKNQVIQLAARQDYDGFYQLEISMRKLQQLPPFGDLTQIVFIGQDEAALLRGAMKFRDSLLSCCAEPAYRENNCTVLGPAPCAVPKINYNFRYRLTLRCATNNAMRQLLAHLLRQFAKDSANRGVSAFVDVNGME